MRIGHYALRAASYAAYQLWDGIVQASINVRHNTSGEESCECSDDLHRGEDETPEDFRRVASQ